MARHLAALVLATLVLAGCSAAAPDEAPDTVTKTTTETATATPTMTPEEALFHKDLGDTFEDQGKAREIAFDRAGQVCMEWLEGGTLLDTVKSQGDYLDALTEDRQRAFIQATIRYCPSVVPDA